MPRRQEALERLAGLVDHAERGVLGAGDLGGRLDDPLQQRVQRQLGAEGDAGVDEDAEAVELVGFRGHAPILP